MTTPTSSAEVKNKLSCTPAAPVRLQGAGWDNVTCTFMRCAVCVCDTPSNMCMGYAVIIAGANICGLKYITQWSSLVINIITVLLLLLLLLLLLTSWSRVFQLLMNFPAC